MLLLVSSIAWAQKPQRIAYIDVAYILENVPEYQAAQESLDKKMLNWKINLSKSKRRIEIL